MASGASHSLRVKVLTEASHFGVFRVFPGFMIYFTYPTQRSVDFFPSHHHSRIVVTVQQLCGSGLTSVCSYEQFV